MFFVSWKKLTFLFFIANLILIFQMYLFISNECEPAFPIHLTTANRQSISPSTLHYHLTLVIFEFETFSHDLNSTLSTFCALHSMVKVLIVSNERPYPPLQLPAIETCNIHLIITRPDVISKWQENDPLTHIKTDYVLIVPQSLKFHKEMPLDHLKFTSLNDNNFMVLPVIGEDSYYAYTCLGLDIDLRRWNLIYRHLDENTFKCNLYQGEFAYFIKREVLSKLNLPFEKPFQESLSIQAKIRGLKIKFEDDLKLWKNSDWQPSERDEMKMESLRKVRLASLYKKLQIKRVTTSSGEIEWYGCNKGSTRCFPSIFNNTPSYLFDNKWTPPCCLENLRKTARRVFSVLEKCGTRYWLEGGSLLGAVRNGDIIPWDFDVDLGIYQEDINNCPLLLYATKQPVKDDEGFIWEKAIEGEFLRVQFSEMNRVHVDLFPFYPKNGMMTKRTWFHDHPQDKEFPEAFLKPLIKIPFVGWQAYAPANVTQFLEYKFGSNVIDNPQYPNPGLLTFPRD
ncbi:ribitol 5-phosphate transferase FKRP-like [Panonychus citri]|uniref:ribitol 5-phosphate transferase FKRP-like n=1 Tax=Panonychus citri TaxID=50023 RepID=UPI002307AD25|nr:ribitol 5-phosphate transferase FKRP-like [Panonychus citri]